MPLKLEEAGFEDMKEIMEITFEAYNNPFDPYLDLIYPGLDPKTPPGYDKGLEQATERALEKWKATPRDVMVWIKIVDTDLSKIVAYVCPLEFRCQVSNVNSQGQQMGFS